LDKTNNHKLKNLISILFISSIFSFGGNNPWVIFNVPSNANDLSLSGSNISRGTIGFYQFANPALLSMTKKMDFGVCYNRMSLDRSTQVISFNLKLPPNAGVGLSVMRSGTSNIHGKDIFNNDTNILENYDILGMISFGVSISEYISAGINIKASSSNLDNLFGDNNEANYSISNKGIGIDVGLLIEHSNLALAIKMENIKSSKSWNLNLYSGSNSYDENIPILYKIGTHYSIFNDRIKFYLVGDNSLDNFSLNRFGLEIGHIKTNLKIKCGISHLLGISPTLGFDYSGEMWDSFQFQLNYGVAFGSVHDGMSHIFTWTFIN